MEQDESRIIEGLRHGDNWAYQCLYDRYYILLCKTATLLLYDDSLAQIFVDDLILYFYEKRETLIINTSLSAYLTRSVKNRCIKYLQSKYDKAEINFSSLDTPEDRLTNLADSDDPLSSLLEIELEERIHSEIKRLPKSSRTVFEKSRYEEKDYTTIAKEMNISISTVKYHIKNALLHLNKNLEKYLLLIFSHLAFC
jgi:RNA polymerase sigma-70 factor (ECF subfamily)